MKKSNFSMFDSINIDCPLCRLLRRPSGCQVVSAGKTAGRRSFHASDHLNGLPRALVVAALFFSLVSAVVTLVHAEGETVQVLNDTAVSLYEQGNYDDAAELAERALKIAEDTMGPDSPQIAPFLNNLAVIYYAQGKYEAAAAAYQRAISVTEPSLGSAHQRVVYFREGLEKCKEKMSGQKSREEISGRSEIEDQAALPQAGQTEKILTPADTAKTATGTISAPPHEGRKVFTVQVGAFRNLLSAKELQGRLEKHGYDVSVLSVATSTGDSFHKVQVGEFSERKQAAKLAREIKTLVELDTFVTTK